MGKIMAKILGQDAVEFGRNNPCRLDLGHDLDQDHDHDLDQDHDHDLDQDHGQDFFAGARIVIYHFVIVRFEFYIERPH